MKFLKLSFKALQDTSLNYIRRFTWHSSSHTLNHRSACCFLYITSNLQPLYLWSGWPPSLKCFPFFPPSLKILSFVQGSNQVPPPVSYLLCSLHLSFLLPLSQTSPLCEGITSLPVTKAYNFNFIFNTISHYTYPINCQILAILFPNNPCILYNLSTHNLPCYFKYSTWSQLAYFNTFIVGVPNS